MTLLQAAGAAILIALTLSLLREGGNRMLLPVALGGGVLLTVWMLSRLGGALGDFIEMTSETAMSPYLTLLLKAIGVGYVVGISADICRDLGAAETAKRIELCGRAELLVLAMPPLTELMRLAHSMAEGV